MNKILPVLFFLMFAGTALAQQRVFDIMDRTDITIDEANTLANRYFDSVGRDRGTGYKTVSTLAV